MHKRRILVIDDSEDIHKDFARLLCPPKAEDLDDLSQMEASLFGAPSSGGDSSEPIELDSAFQGQEGLAKVQEAQAAGRPYALVFLDYRMPPGWNGYETLRRLHQVAPSVPVVLCSAFSDFSWEKMDKEFAGAHVLKELRKPFDKGALQKLVRTLTEPGVS
ncbi:response regulator [Hyalangium minutum]|uniref:Sensor histidine kinase/response regulator n=1 Tax=Hyalangium minutum TaxID=394096 RepID=A0A085WRU5_9BACT|nr:response regulator [Hyalangium minutum]KFE70408.1 sensor histidine kinase/response regulator [Hyalangium minutum]